MKIALGYRGYCKSSKWDLGQRPRNFAIFVHCSTPGDLKLIKLPVEKSDTGKISSNKTFHYLPLSKRKKDTLTLLKVIGGWDTCPLYLPVLTALKIEV